MNNKKRVIFLGACMLPMLSARAQQQTYRDSTIKAQTIQITQIYTPEIAQPEKPALTPALPRIDTTKPSFQYEVPQQTLSYTYRSIPIRPLALGRQETQGTFENYIKAGGGNLSSVYIDAGIGSLKGANYETAFHFSHLSQKSRLPDQQSSNTAFDAAGKYTAGAHTFGAQLHVMHSGNRFYGYDTSRYDYETSALKQAFMGGRISLEAYNHKENKWNVWYHPRLAFGMYSDLFHAKERSLAFDIPASKMLTKALRLSLGVSGNLVQFQNQVSTAGNNLFQINPALSWTLKSTDIHIGVSPAFGKDNTAYLLPDLSLKSHLLQGNLSFALGWKGTIIQNTFEELSTENPFINNRYPVQQTKSDQVFAGLESAVGQHFTFGGTLSWRQWKNMALFVNDYTTDPSGKQFQVIYDEKVQALNLEAFARYQTGDVFGLSARGSWYNFYQTTTYAKVWEEPMLRLNATLDAHPLKKLYAGATLDFWDGIYVRKANGKADKLPAFLDLGATASYQIIPRLSVFVQLHNILNNKYERWNQYEHYGFNIIGGFRFKF